MSAADLLGCLCALLLIAGMAAIIGDGISMARRAARSSQPRIRIIDI